jgi:hypothetical protein
MLPRHICTGRYFSNNTSATIHLQDVVSIDAGFCIPNLQLKKGGLWSSSSTVQGSPEEFARISLLYLLEG